MKKIKIGIVLLTSVMIAGLVLFSFGATAAKPAPQEIDKVVFVHYPQPKVNGSYWFPANAPTPTDENTRYKYTGIHWVTMSVGYAVNPSGAPDGSGGIIGVSFNTWQLAPGDITFDYLGTTDVTTDLTLSTRDEKNVVSWQDITTDFPGAIAITIVWYYRGSKEIVEVDTVMNSGSGFNWSVNTGFTGDPDIDTGNSEAYDVQNIMTHEAGHWLMLGDLYQWNTQKLTMFGYGEKGELQKRTLGTGDELGIDRIY